MKQVSPLSFACALALCLVSADLSAAGLERYESTVIRMGVPVTITVYAPSEEAANTGISAAFARIKELNSLLSDYDPDSELMRLCRSSSPGVPVAVSRELFFVLDRAEEISRKSDGAFDVTVGPVVQLWRKARRTKQLPDPAELAQATALVGYRNVRLDREKRTVELLKPGMRLDLGGIAKGYAADEAVKTLNEHGLTRVLVAAAGDIVAGDAPPGKAGWRVGIAAAESPDAPPQRFLSLANCAVSTSGDAYQFVEINGRRYSHIVDPKTGLGLTTRRQATVIAREGISADSLGKVLCVHGGERGLKQIESRPKTEALVIEMTAAGESAERSTKGFGRYLVGEE